MNTEKHGRSRRKDIFATECHGMTRKNTEEAEEETRKEENNFNLLSGGC